MNKVFIIFCCSLLLLTACDTSTKNETAGTGTDSSALANNSEESKEERNKQNAMESVRAINNNNPDEALKSFDADAIDYFDGSGPAMKGLDSIKAGVKMWMNNMEGYKGENLEAFDDGNKVLVYGEWSGTFKGDFMGMKVAGKKFKVKDVDIFKFNEQGKITEHRSVQSMAGLMASTEPGKK
ncbi:MAG: ester cyclase [Chitinophagaceae bacterium]